MYMQGGCKTYFTFLFFLFAFIVQTSTHMLTDDNLEMHIIIIPSSNITTTGIVNLLVNAN